MIEQFPNFSHLELEHKKQIDDFTSQFEPYSDFNFTSLFCWDTQNQTQVAVLHDNLVIKLSDYLTGKVIYSILGDDRIQESLDALFKHTSTLQLVPSTVIQALGEKDTYNVVEDRGAADYIYRLEDLSTLNGGKLKKKRNKLNRLLEDIGDSLEVQTFTELTDKELSEFSDVLIEWGEKNSSKDTQNEKIAIQRLLKSSHELELLFFGIRYQERLVGFSINEKISDDYSVCHFEKALMVHENIYTYIANKTAQELLKTNCRYINWEQDLGIPGLRKAKLAYNPIKLLKKYTVVRISVSQNS